LYTILSIQQAKGYPDIASRRFLKYVADHSPRVEMLALVDYDPDGIAILSTYKYGSYRLAHENVTTGGTTTLSLPRLRWLGVRGHQISRAPVTKPDKGDNDLVDAQGLMKLTARDRNKARQMLEWNLCSEGGPEPEWRRELQMMLMLNIKAEMQILEEFPGGLPKWLVHQLEGAQERYAGIGGAASLATDTGSDDELLL
jgi:meiotic recombination protein SPO11